MLISFVSLASCTKIICEAIIIFHLWGQASSVSYIWMHLENEDFLLYELQEEMFHLDQLIFPCVLVWKILNLLLSTIFLI
jgi:hypothetical protein